MKKILLTLLTCIGTTSCMGISFTVPDGEKEALLGLKAKQRGDYAQAQLYWQKGCDSGGGTACGQLGFLYAEGGRDIQQDNNLATHYLQKSCRLNYKPACKALR